MSQPSLFFVRPESREAESSPELAYLASLVRLEAGRAFAGGVSEAVAAGSILPPVPAGAHALVLGSTAVLLTRRSLAALARRVAAGAPAAAPLRLAETGELAAVPVYTLRGFEHLEARQLAAAGAPPPRPPLAALLLAPDTARRLAGAPLAGLLAGEAVETAAAGLCHEFIDYYGEARGDVLPHLPAGARRVLEVGCARGATGRLLAAELGCEVTGVELNPVVAAEAARHLHRVVAGDVEDPAVAAELGGGFDALLALELFEHLVEPEGFLAAARRLVRPGGRIVLSVPNVGHYSVVEDLLAGRWDYLPIGLLCYTHYRFFTRRTLEDWLGRCGFGSFTLVPQPTEPPPWLAGGTEPPPGMEIDAESLATRGFFVLAEV